mmetsp:Transcript_41105/g.124179  ORF Transcript_41105/g.124179 Transcript_41105/m.124179 type:complete len:348 (-) Transcript_41105:295-1338(-)|eukprot:CAMPEP_0113549982 /NCGR_PEP_ID=MMETSP0015_2-20120614/13735_1 /TAXON_ID=2838 /ORGANISM="Odontella" /LENGTH=347 /DNA_ID=CAMNT_0000450751 /DNA_START=130 /DNA_END=1173 /DNA_ORIENTATION=+ /assembly_acc=CAM_ASM_000160
MRGFLRVSSVTTLGLFLCSIIIIIAPAPASAQQCKSLYGAQSSCSAGNGCQKCATSPSIFQGKFQLSCVDLGDDDGCCGVANDRASCENRQSGSAPRCEWTWTNSRMTKGECTVKGSTGTTGTTGNTGTAADGPIVGSRQECRTRTKEKCNARCRLSSNGNRCRPNRQFVDPATATATATDSAATGVSANGYRIGSRKYCQKENLSPQGFADPSKCKTLTGCDWDIAARKCLMASKVDNPVEGTQAWCKMFDINVECAKHSSCDYIQVNDNGRMECRLREVPTIPCVQIGFKEECNSKLAWNCVWRDTRNNGNPLAEADQSCVVNSKADAPTIGEWDTLMQARNVPP